MSQAEPHFGAQHTPNLIFLHLSTPNQLGLLFDLLKSDNSPFLRGEPLHLRFQAHKEVALGSDQRNKQMLVVVDPSMLSSYCLHLLRVDHYSELDSRVRT